MDDVACLCDNVFVADIPCQYRRLQGLLQGRPHQDRLAANGGTQEAIPDPLNIYTIDFSTCDSRPVQARVRLHCRSILSMTYRISCAPAPSPGLFLHVCSLARSQRHVSTCI